MSKRVLAVASAGGHWVQLARMSDAFGADVHYASTSYPGKEFDSISFHKIKDGNLKDKVSLFFLALSILILIIKVRPEVIVSTGAAPGFFAIILGKALLGSKTIWVDSIANGEEPSLAGQKVRRWADVWATQWEDLAEKYGMVYLGAVV
jgi:UDP-N-acetylglucosamine:LPS N-acetylglucosamine transferase